MGVFDQKYREPLQAVVDHARRFRAFLDRLEIRHPDPEQWLVGRREEVGLVVSLRVRDWRAHRIGLEFAARTIRAYLDELHLAAARSLGLPANVAFDCCPAHEAITVRLGGGRSPPANVEPQDSRGASAGETWLDLHAQLDLGPSAQGGGEPASDRDADPCVLHVDLAEPRANRS